MGKSPDKKEPEYIAPSDSQDEVHPDVAQDPDEIALQSLPQVRKGQEIEPTERVTAHTVGKPRRQTTGILEKDKKKIKAQDPRRVDITVFTNEGTGQYEFVSTADVQSRFEETGVRPSDHQEIQIQTVETIDPSDVSGAQLSTVRKQKNGASLKYTPVHNPGSRIKSG